MKLIASGIVLAAAVGLAAFVMLPNRVEAVQAQEWPLEIEGDRARILLYQPQPEALDGDQLSARAAVSVTPKGSKEPVFGAVWLVARIATDRDTRTVTVQEIRVPQVRFPGASDEQREQLVRALESELPKLEMSYSLDSLVASLDEEEHERVSARGLKNDPPRIVYSPVPATLITLDGEPKLQPVERSKVMRVVNTPFVLLFEPESKTYFLKAGGAWVSASEITGPWTDVSRPPAQIVSAVPADSDSATPSKPPRIIVATEPTELIVTDGEPQLEPYAGNELLSVSNTENALFLDVPTNQYFVLLSGRWFVSSSLERGPWTFVPADQLPAAFAQIPASSEQGDVRAHVAGTPEAREAVLDASIPQTAAIKRDAPGPKVTYDGDPRFEAIDGTDLKYALNTPFSVIECRGKFYCCDQGVWYIAPAPKGPWSVCTEVPNEIYAIPASVPVYPVTYVHVYDVYPDVVYCGYLPGYYGCYVWGPTIVWGTGWFYPGWYGVHYFAHPWTWGFAAHYDPWTCGWGFGFSHGWGGSHGWLAFSVGWSHDWSDHGWWGPCGFQARHVDVHSPLARTPTAVASTSLGLRPTGRDNLYNRRESVARRVDAGRTGIPPTSGKQVSVREAQAPARARIAAQEPNDVFADRDGSVLRRSQDGAWQRLRDGTWRSIESAQPPDPGRVPPSTRPEALPPSTRPPTTRPDAPPATRPSPPPSVRPSSPIRPPNSFERASQGRLRGSIRTQNFQRATRPGGRGRTRP